jgi:hypothetical protein
MASANWQETRSVPVKTEHGNPLVIGMGASPVQAHGREWYRAPSGAVFSRPVAGLGSAVALNQTRMRNAVNLRMQRAYTTSPRGVSLRHPHVGMGQAAIFSDSCGNTLYSDGSATCADGSSYPCTPCNGMTVVQAAAAAGITPSGGGGGGGGISLQAAAAAALAALNADPNYCADVAVAGSAVNTAVHNFKSAWNAANPTTPVPINTGNYEPSVAAALNSLVAGAPAGCGGGVSPGPAPAPGPSPSPAPDTMWIVGGAVAAAAIVGGALYYKKKHGRRR